MPETFVPFGTAMQFLQDALHLPVEGSTALEARVRQLATMGVPRMRRASANARFLYGLQEVAEIALALALIDGRMAPATAARYVRERWSVFAPAAVEGAGDQRPPGYADERPKRGGPVVVIGGNALSTLGTRAMRDKTPEPLAMTKCYFDSEDAVAGLEGLASASWVNLNRFMPRIVELFTEHSSAREDMWESLDRLRQSEKSRDD